MSGKKKARRRGEHVTYFFDPMTGGIVDWNPSNQIGQPANMSFREWEEKHQDKLYLVVDEDYVKPPVIVHSQETLNKYRKKVKDEAPKVAAAEPSPSKEREKALRLVAKAAARWQGSNKAEDLLKAKHFAEIAGELWPDLKEEILEEFKT